MNADNKINDIEQRVKLTSVKLEGGKIRVLLAFSDDKSAPRKYKQLREVVERAQKAAEFKCLLS